MPDEEQDEWKAPYISYETLVNFLDKKLGANPVPPRIDRGFLDNYAGSVQPLLLGTLRTIGFIDDNNTVQDSLRYAVTNVGLRKEALRSWAESYYAEQLDLAKQTATAQMLHESFSRHKYTGSTLRKAVVFFLALCDDVGLPKSPHFKPPRQVPAPAASTRKTRRSGKTDAGAAAAGMASGMTSGNPGPAGAAERKTVSFGPAGTVTIEVNVRWLDLPDKTFQGLRKVVQDLAALEAEVGTAGPDDTPVAE
jgi:hypothetical protein